KPGDVLANMAAPLARALGTRVRVEIHAEDAAWPVRADAAQLDDCLLNLALNARDAMPTGGRVTIGLAHRPVSGPWVAQRGSDLAPGDYVELTVADTGVGMDSATRARVFEPFFTTKPVGQGTGLGLSVVDGIVQQSGGQVSVYSEAGRGTTVKIVLPVARGRRLSDAHAVPLEQGSAVATNGRAPVGGNERLLVVDDEPVVLGFLSTLLRDAGYEVYVATRAEEALEIFTARSGGGSAIDLVLSDLIMPGMGGRMLGEALMQVAPETPVLYSSGYTGDEVARRGLLAAGAEFLSKPFSPEQVLNRVRQLLDGRKQPT
ncbi:MAG: response regulator, partial [Gemmatimonadales bacterium]|nr:response regulator [Gemmatimonadales bacterium]